MTRAVIAVVLLLFGKVTCGEPAKPDIFQPFTFTLAPHHDYALSETVKVIQLHDDTEREKAIETANAPVLTKALDLLRYIPIHLGPSEGDDFFLPAYLHPEFREVRVESHLFDKP